MYFVGKKCFVIVNTCFSLYTRSAVVVSSREGYIYLQKTCHCCRILLFCQCWFYFLSCLLLKVLMYSLNLMISLISVPSLASISHCYQINFLVFFFFYLFRSFRSTAELNRKHRVPASSLPSACTAFPSISVPSSGSLVTISAPLLTQHRPSP